MRITMKQIAEKAGVHRSTVDKVLHGRPGVSEPVRERIKSIIEECGYQPNEAGFALRMQEKTFRIAVILMDVNAVEYNQRGIERGLSEYQAYNILTERHILDPRNAEPMLEILRSIERERSADGVILMPHSSDDLKRSVNALKAAGIPTVLINSDLSDCDALCYIGADNARSGRFAAHLMGLCLGGRGKIAMMVSSVDPAQSNASVKVREEAFRAFVRAEYPEMEIAATEENFESPEISYEKTLRLLRERADLRGIYNAGGGAYKLGVAVEESGLSGKLVVITHELYPEIIRLIERGTITCTIGSELNNQGFLAAKTLMDALIFKKYPNAGKLYTKSELILKENADAAEP